MCQDTAGRRAQIQGAISSGDLKQTTNMASITAANYQGALAALALAQLNLAYVTIRTPVAEYITHLRLRPGGCATAGVTRMATVDNQRL